MSKRQEVVALTGNTAAPGNDRSDMMLARSPSVSATTYRPDAPGADHWPTELGDGKAQTILIVDDDQVLRGAVAGELEGAGFGVVEAGSGPSAIEILEAQRVDAVLLEQRLPGPPGVDLAAWIRKAPRYGRIPVLFLSADDSPETRLAALRAGATDFMVKPFPLPEVLARLGSQLQVSTRWAATVSGIRSRAALIAELAALGGESDPVPLAARICDRISAAHESTGVAIFSWLDRVGDPALLAASGRSADLFATAGPRLARHRGNGPWVGHFEDEPSADPSSGVGSRWAVCCPMRQRRNTVGILVLAGEDQAEEDLLAAAVDYAPTVALLLGQALGDSHRERQSRERVEQTLAARAYEAVFQPIVQIASGRILGYEALTRLDSGDPIISLLAEATEAGMRAECEIRLLGEALRAAAALGDTWISGNLSPSVVVSRNDDLAKMIDASGCQVVIELTENERIEDYVSVRESLGRLGDGVRLSVDDAGAGYASLRHVIDLHPHFLKLDRSWITGLDRDETRQALVAGMVAFCRHTNTEMIAEGVETASELETLRRLKVRLAQGYLLGRPAPLSPPPPP